MILLEHGPDRQPAVFGAARATVVAHHPDEVAPALGALDRARDQGLWVAGYLAYEAGYALEDKLRPLMPPVGTQAGPLLAFGLYDGPEPAGPALERARVEAAGVALGPVRTLIAEDDYGRAFAKVKDYIASGDCYQINLTFPMQATLLSGTPLGLYGALARRQKVGFGAYVDLGVGPVLVSRSPELFFRTDARGHVESRPMKGTAPRDPDPVRDAQLAEEMRASDKGRAENLMIVDLLRNDIARIARVGSVKVPQLFAVESYATVHQMVSRVVGELVEPPSLARLMAALFPCGSITGAPKIRAMEIIAEVEQHPRGAYCGAIGWMAPDGAAEFNVAIRTLSVAGAQVTLNVGGGVVQDSTAAGEWEEAHWKARFATGLARQG